MNYSSGQVQKLLRGVNYKYAEPTLVKCLAVHNEEDWVEANLANCYDEFDIIRVVEGAVVGRPGSTEDGHSTDATLELVRNFPDPEDKIELYTRDRHFKSLEEQKQTFLNLASEGEWLFIVDCDEFYLKGDVERVRNAIRKRPTASEIIPTFLHFYRDIYHVRASHPEWQPQHQRIIRYREGLKYHTHPVATDAQGKCTYFDPGYQLDRYTMPGLYIFHYGHAKSKDFHEMKQKFYKSELEKFKLEDGTDASDKFDDKFIEFMEYTEDLSQILTYEGKHPEEIEKHPVAQYRESFYEDKSFSGIESDIILKADTSVPTIALLMAGPWKKTEPVINYLN